MKDERGRPLVRRKSSATPMQRSEEVSSVAKTDHGESVRTERTVGTSGEYAHEYGTKKTIFRTYQVLWYLLGLLEVILGFRFLLRLFGANPHSGFASFIYGISGPFLQPFTNLFRNTPVETTPTVATLEWSTIVAGIVYALLVWGILELVALIKPTNPEEVERGIQA